MVTISISFRSIEDLVEKIRKDIYNLRVQGMVRDSDIKISMPIFFQEIIQYSIPAIYLYKRSMSELWGNFEIVPGYNNQICVFNQKARPGDFSIEPFQINLNEK
jgi:hypothetical protein